MNTPVQCSDDLCGPPDCQTGQEVDVASLQSATNARDLATDAQADQRPQRPPAAPVAPAPRYAGDGGAQKSPDEVFIQDPHGATIHATGLAGNLRPGAFMQIGTNNHMEVHRYADGSTRTTTAAAAPIRNRLTITNNPRVPEDRHLSVVSQGLAGGWRSVGRRLGLRDTALDQIWLDYHQYGLQEVNHRMLRKWIESFYPTSVHTLASALADTGHGDLADKLSQMN